MRFPNNKFKAELPKGIVRPFLFRKGGSIMKHELPYSKYLLMEWFYLILMACLFQFTIVPVVQGQGCPGGCDDGEICTADYCVKDACVNEPLTGHYCEDDGDVCTADVCENGDCKHNPVSGIICGDDGNPCTSDVCQEGLCNKVLLSGRYCGYDGNPCTSDYCNNGVCHSSANNGIICGNDGNECTTDVCDEGACVKELLSFGGCNDDNICTDPDSCVAGVCVGLAKACCSPNACLECSINAESGECECENICEKIEWLVDHDFDYDVDGLDLGNSIIQIGGGLPQPGINIIMYSLSMYFGKVYGP